MLCLVYVVVYHALFAGVLAYSHLQAHGLNVVQLVLAVFSAINAWIAVCEIALLVHASTIRKQYLDFDAKLGTGRLPPIFLFEHASLSQIFSLRYWAVMWSTYSVLDPSYSDTTTFGFCVDIGNGCTTLLPTLLWAAGMTWPVLPPRVLGTIGIAMYWQEFYGTVLYFFQYCYNRRFDRSPRAHVLAIVVPANGIWLACPALGMWASYQLIVSGDFSVFGQ